MNQKIKRAFKELKKQGIIAKMSFKCCQNCALTAIHDKKGNNVGCVFYTHQDTESFQKDGKLYLSFSAFNGNHAGIAATVINALTKVGLSPQWNGNINTRIQVL
jgi:hypothetical protein